MPGRVFVAGRAVMGLHPGGLRQMDASHHSARGSRAIDQGGMTTAATRHRGL